MFLEIKSKFIFQKIFISISEKSSLKIIKNSKRLQNKLNKSIEDYIKIHNQIEIELIPILNLHKEENTIINYTKNKSYFHIYPNNSNIEIKRNYITKNDHIDKIRVIIDLKMNSFRDLFKRCYCLKEINFTKCYQKDINDMSYLFCGCSNLIKYDISKIDTKNVNNISGMFMGCESLKDFNFQNFNTFNVTNMRCLFNLCSSLIDINISNFITDKVTDMSSMFEACGALEKLNIKNFNIINVNNMCGMFSKCTS